MLTVTLLATAIAAIAPDFATWALELAPIATALTIITGYLANEDEQS